MALDNANPLARIAEKPVDRRFLLRTMGGGALAAAAIPVLAACTGSGRPALPRSRSVLTWHFRYASTAAVASWGPRSP